MVTPIEVSDDPDNIDDNDIHLHMQAMADLHDEEVIISEREEHNSSSNLIEYTEEINNDANTSKISYENVMPTSPKAILSVHADHDADHYNDDDISKVLTTLEPIAKDQEEIPEDNTIVFEVIIPHEDVATTVITDEKGTTIPISTSIPEAPTIVSISNANQIEEYELARMQLDDLSKPCSRGRPKSSKNRTSSDSVDKKQRADSATNGVMSKAKSEGVGRKTTITSKILTKNEIKKEISQLVAPLDTSDVSPLQSLPKQNLVKNMQNRLAKTIEVNATTPIRPIIKPEPNTGTIEIPSELILGSDDSALIFNTSDTSTKSLLHEDLLAILEGNDEDEAPEQKHTEPILDKEAEKQIAMKQMLALPQKQKGRPKNQTSSKPSEKRPIKKSIKRENVSALVTSLVSEWSESDSESQLDVLLHRDDIKVEPDSTTSKPPRKVVKVEVVKPTTAEPTFKRSRIIKKKIIWDPDAPETAISYASFVHSSSSSTSNKKSPPVKKPLAEPKILNKSKLPDDKPKEAKKRSTESTSPSAMKKRKISEIDKLLGDEGAVNMLNALKQENNNGDASSDTSEHQPARARAKRPQTPQKSSPPATTIKKEGVKRKKSYNPKSDSWDYIYSHRGDDSMIIRRRSNSSYSSTTSPRRLSIDASHKQTKSSASSDTASDKAVDHRKPTVSKFNKMPKSTKEKNFEFAKPISRQVATSNNDATTAIQHSILMDIQDKSNKIMSNKNANKIQAARRSARSATICDYNRSPPMFTLKPPKEKKLTPKMETTVDEKSVEKKSEEDMRVERDKGVVDLIFSPNNNGPIKNSYTIPFMNAVTKALHNLSTDAACKLVVLSTATDTFCNGIDYSVLVPATPEKRKAAALELSNTVKNFINTLGSFKKPIIACVSGQNSGIGVTILPLFDVVFASKNATFETPYAKIGQIPEGITVLTASNKISQSARNELIFLCETLNAYDACEHGLVTKILTTNNNAFKSEVLGHAQTISALSAQTFEATKAFSQRDFLPKLLDGLAEEQKLLVGHWTSAECQQNITQFLNTHNWS